MTGEAALHVVLCTDGVFPHAMGGMQRHSRLLAEHLAALPGIRLTVIHPHAQRVFSEHSRIEEVRVAALDSARNYLLELWRYSGRVAAELDRLRPDAILSQGFSVWKGIARFGARMAMMPHGLEMYQGLTARDRMIGLPFRWLVRHVARRSGRVISLGGKLTPMLESITAGSAARVVVLPNAVDLAATVRYPGDERGIRLLFVGRFAFNKGIDLLMALAREFVQAHPAVTFLMAGDGPEREAMERSGIPANVSLLGKVSDADLERLYADCHALLLPTRFEGMPTVVLEAMARARPAIVSDVGAAAELVDSSNGWLIRPGELDSLREAVSAFIAMPPHEREAMGARGRERAEQRFTWSKVAQGFAQLAAELAAGD